MVFVRPIQLMISGAQRSGTTSLLHYLDQHPGICRSHVDNEIPYFIDDRLYEEDYEKIFKQYFNSDCLESDVILAKSINIMYQPAAIRRLVRHNPDVQIIIILRNPVDRAYSGYWYARRRGLEREKTFEKALDAWPRQYKTDKIRLQECAHLDRSLYVKHLKNLFTYFKKEQVHIYLFEDILSNAVYVCQKIFSLFKELDPVFTPVVNHAYNKSKILPVFYTLALLTNSRQAFPRLKKAGHLLLGEKLGRKIARIIRKKNIRRFDPPPMDKKLREHLLLYFKPHNDKLSDMIGRDLNHWNK